MSPIEQYKAGTNFISAAKMNYTHYFLKQLTGWTLHPNTGIQGKKSVRIADMGSQTAVWAIDVAEDQSFEADVHAFDISNKFFPPTPWLPPNVTLHRQDICSKFPSTLLETFDVVHFRLFIMLDEENIRSMVKSAISLLKPGGYIQWIEHDKTGLKPITASKDQDTSAVEALIELEKNPFPNYNFRWINSIAPVMAAEGLDVVVEERIETRASLLTQMHELHLIALLDIPRGMSETVDTFKANYFDDLASDNAKGIASVDNFKIIIARKPM
ncbi:hypothetical protein DM02DRAFT_597673 [Periconia macrospinosa]|uniref:Methyltransferase domain-containing protein n=1 Tax=Periconia macrospinosa TaxID=97972 RepID=A0A2V1DJV8_9PLEO|nr:hypothetical protein DM02DRAFT_597673 [Periconia macrospinosa]